jgi:hypothetical protein
MATKRQKPPPLVPMPLDNFFEPVTRDIRETKTVVERVIFELELARDEIHHRSSVSAISIIEDRIAEYRDALAKMNRSH